jgi:hypothetical protein
MGISNVMAIRFKPQLNCAGGSCASQRITQRMAY